MVTRLRALVALLVGSIYLCNAAPPLDPGILATTPSEPGCPDGWYLLNGVCLALRGYGANDGLNWRDAEAACVQEATDIGGANGHLAQIYYDGINSLITSFLKIVTKDVWIGLWANGGNGELTWIDNGMRYAHENFARGEPSLDLSQDVCIKMLNDPGKPGEWISVFCTDTDLAYVCQMPPDPKWDPNPPLINRCNDQDYQSYFLSCYKFVTDVATYADAKAACEAEGAVLASFPDRYELSFGETVMHFNKISGIWLGLEMDHNNQYKWIDGWPLTYTDWYRNEPNEGGCAMLDLNGWYDSDCGEQRPYFCKTTQETRPTPPPPGFGFCEEGWIRWNETCYRFPETISAKTWDEANYECQSQYGGSTLASVHSDDEGLFLRTQATLAWGSPLSFWIGLSIAEDGYYDWKDNTLLDYQNWRLADGQPDINWPDDGVGCAFMPPDSTDWFDDGCGVNKRFVCKVPLSYSTEPGCPSGWFLLDGKCYTLSGYSPNSQLNFNDAEAMCAQNPGGHLAKIEHPAIDSLITSFLKIVPGDVWIGLSTNNGTGRFSWTDGTELGDHTNWGPEQPDGDLSQNMCAKLLNDPNDPGKWNDVYCDEQENAYMCMQPGDPNLPGNPPIISRCGRPDYQSYYLSCFKFVDGGYTYEQAKQACMDDSAQLASFTDKYELSFARTVMYNNRAQMAWFGLESDMETGQFGYVDGWPLTFTDWQANEPVGGGCVAIDSDLGWTDVSCTENFGYFCKYTEEITPTVDPDPPGYCPSDWDRFGNSCYKFDEGSQVETFDSANYMCQSLYGATLASVHSEEEGKFIRETATERLSATPIWLGLQQDEEGFYSWKDQTLLDYHNWNTGEPSMTENSCGFMNSAGPTWGDDSCTTTKKYVCKAPLFGTTGGCPSGWYKLINRCYALFGRGGEQSKTYDQAQSFCSSFPDGNLASIQLQSQQSLLTSVMRATTGDIWIGLNNRGGDGTFHWQDGSELTYTNWNFGQPDSGADSCGKMHNDPNSPGRWIDVYCSDMNAYLCQRPVDLSLPDNPPLLSNCPEDWQSYFGSCFKVHADQPLSYAAAKDRCEAYYEGATYLSSMKDRYEQAFTEVLFYISEAESGWFGLERDPVSGKHSYANQWPLDFTNWGMEEPSGDGCVAQINMDTKAYWADMPCEEEKAYICKYTLDPVPPAPTIDPYGYCPSGWMRYNGHCYRFNAEKRAQTWDAAQYECQTDFASSLASVHDMAENNFITQNALDVFGEGNIWLGLKRDDYGYFTWSNREFVVYENWGEGQPDGRERSEDCIELQVNRDGMWNDDDCFDTANYVCKMPEIGAEGGCPGGWYKLDRKCYTLKGTNNPMTWANARQYCIDNAIGDGNLATIWHPGLQSLLTSIMKAFPIDLWIGLYTNGSDPRWQWASGEPVDYTSWGPEQPDGNPDQWSCVKMLNDPNEPGLWNDVACADDDDQIEPELNAFLCESNLDPTLPGNPPIVSNCLIDGYQSYFDSCFRVETDPMTYSQARAVCQSEGGELASLTERYQENFAKTVLYNNRLDEMWIGLMADEMTGEYKWTDEWPLSFTSWGENEPNGAGCVTLTEDEVWVAADCMMEKGFICKYTLATKPQDPPAKTGYCPNGWDRYEEMCYLFDSDLSPRSFDAASYECQSQYGAQLASVHNNAELEFIMERAGDTFTASTIWIGMQRWGDAFRWSDQSLINYVNWDDAQPTMDNCVEMDIENTGRWGTDDCNDNSAFICKAPVFGEGGGCPGGWYRLRERCYKLGGQTEGTRMTWQNARDTCMVDGGDNGNLASIQVYGIQSLLTAILKGVGGDVWIGLNNLEGNFEWADQTPVVYTNWSPGQPDSGTGVCVKMSNDPEYYPGSWVDVYCSQENAYLCQTVTDPSLPGNPPIISQCQRDGYQSYFQSCFRTVTEPMTYADAQQFCINDLAELASLEDRYEQAFVEVSTLNNEVDDAWLGLRANADSGRYEFSDDWPLTFTKWAVNEPSNLEGSSNDGCIHISNMNNGSWVDSDCAMAKPFICKYTQQLTPTPPPVEMGYCPDGWEMYGGSCYRFRESKGAVTWDEAQYDCQTDYGAHLAYLHDNDEAMWVAEMVNSNYGASTWAWIGLRRDADTDMFTWTNQDLVDYVNWASSPAMEGSCAQMLSSTGEWRESGCTSTREFVCKMPQLGPVGGCDDGWYKLLNKCYRLGGALDGTQPLSWYDANSQCGQALGGQLANVFNKGLQSFLTAILKGLEGDVWIGLSTVGQSGVDREFRWDDGSALNYTNWTPGQPDGDLDGDNCVKMLNDPMYPGTWNDLLCSEAEAYLCEADLDPSKPANPPIVSRCSIPDYQSYISNCFKLVEEPMTYAEADQYCMAEGTELASFSDKYEQAFIQTTMYANNVGGVWLGLSRDQASGVYAWDNGWPLDWTNWGLNEPSGDGCLAFTSEPAWEAHDCAMRMPFVCKFRFDAIPETPPVTEGNCPAGWVKFGTSCYYARESTPAGTWDDGQYTCQTMFGSHLASVHSHAENAFLQEQATLTWGRASVWLGMDRDNNNQFAWTDFSQVDYVNWNINEPNGYPFENCLEFNSETGMWGDDDCADYGRFICKLAQVEGEVPTEEPPPEPTNEPPVEPTNQPQTGELSTGEIVGIAVGAGVGLLVIIFLVYACSKDSKSGGGGGGGGGGGSSHPNQAYKPDDDDDDDD